MVSQISIDKKLQDLLAEQVSKIKADYAEIRVEETSATRIVFRGPQPEGIAQPYSLGFFVRVLINGSWGVVSFTDLSKLEEKISQAINFAKLQGKGDIELAQIPDTTVEIIPNIKNDFRGIPLSQKVDLVKHYNNLLLEVEGVQSSNTGYSDSHLTKFFTNSKGARILQVRPYIRLVGQAIARSDEVIEMYRASKGAQGGFEIVEGLDESMVQTAKEAVELTKVSKVKGGKYTVILDPFIAGTFAHEAFGHLSEADHQFRDKKLLEQMRPGKKIGSESATIIDDPTIENGWGSFVYDDEGVKADPVNLLTKGVISGRLHSLETATKLKEQPNGRARADGFTNEPIVRMSNTFFQPGQHNLEDLIASTDKGLLVINWSGGMTMLENFTFTALYGVMIEKGKLTQKVRGVKMTGNVFETLKNIEGVSNDLAFDEGVCGKNGQSMPAGGGGGYVRINNVTVGGQ